MNNGTNKGSANGTEMQDNDNKIHRIRISSQEIKLIAEALKELQESEKTKNKPWTERRLLDELAHRFKFWGAKDNPHEPRFYARTRRDSS